MVTISPMAKNATQGQQVTFSCSATGLAADTFVYGWLLNGVHVEKENNSSLVSIASEDTAGDYQCTVRNVYEGFSKSSKATLILSEYATQFLMFV